MATKCSAHLWPFKITSSGQAAASFPAKAPVNAVACGTTVAALLGAEQSNIGRYRVVCWCLKFNGWKVAKRTGVRDRFLFPNETFIVQSCLPRLRKVSSTQASTDDGQLFVLSSKVSLAKRCDDFLTAQDIAPACEEQMPSFYLSARALGSSATLDDLPSLGGLVPLQLHILSHIHAKATTFFLRSSCFGSSLPNISKHRVLKAYKIYKGSL